MQPNIPTMTKRNVNLEDSFGYILGRAARTMGAHINRRFEKVGFEITCEQWSILVSLWQHDGQTQQELAGQTCKDKTSMTRLIDTMERHGLVKRTANDKDRRQKRIVLTAKGRAMYSKVVALMQKSLGVIEKKIAPRDVAICKKVLCQVYNHLTEMNHI